MKDPEALAGSHVEAANEAFDVGLAFRNTPGPVRRSHNHDIVGDNGRRVQPDLAGHQVDFLIVFHFQIDDAVGAETRNWIAGLGIQRDQPVAGRYVQDPLFAAVGPVGESAAR